MSRKRGKKNNNSEITKKHTNLQRKGRTYGVEEFLNIIKEARANKQGDVSFEGDMVKTNSDRYTTFIEKGVVCCECGLEGKFFAKERTGNVGRYHFNLYAIDKNGDEVLMTKDHIYPVSKGRANHISNYRTMCKVCNERKADKVEVELLAACS
jgi:5-methylcytosine-specific restriction endonuclease McrA